MNFISFPNFIAGFVERYFRVLLVVMLLSAAVGFLTDRMIGGYTAEVAGTVQFICLVIYCFFAIVYFLFRPYGQSAMKALESWPLAAVRMMVFVVVFALTLYFIGYSMLSFTDVS